MSAGLSARRLDGLLRYATTAKAKGSSVVVIHPGVLARLVETIKRQRANLGTKTSKLRRQRAFIRTLEEDQNGRGPSGVGSEGTSAKGRREDASPEPTTNHRLPEGGES